MREGGNAEVVSHNAKMTFSDFTRITYQHPTNNWSLMVPVKVLSVATTSLNMLISVRTVS